MNRYLATSLVATAAGAFLVFVAHGCALNPFADYSYEEAQKELAGPSSSATGTGSTGGFGGAGGAAGAGGTGGVMPCICVDDQNLCTDDVVGECPDGVDEKSCHKAIANVANSACTQANGDPGFCDALAFVNHAKNARMRDA